MPGTAVPGDEKRAHATGCAKEYNACTAAAIQLRTSDMINIDGTFNYEQTRE